ncbi:MAG: hypothetical protein WCA77_05245 [Thermoplasmata archaeon]
MGEGAGAAAMTLFDECERAARYTNLGIVFTDGASVLWARDLPLREGGVYRIVLNWTARSQPNSCACHALGVESATAASFLDGMLLLIRRCHRMDEVSGMVADLLLGFDSLDRFHRTLIGAGNVEQRPADLSLSGGMVAGPFRPMTSVEQLIQPIRDKKAMRFTARESAYAAHWSCGHCRKHPGIYSTVWQPFISATYHETESSGPDRIVRCRGTFLDHALFGLYWASWQLNCGNADLDGLAGLSVESASERFGVRLERAGLVGAHGGRSRLVIAYAMDPVLWRGRVLSAIERHTLRPRERRPSSDDRWIQRAEYARIAARFARTADEPPSAKLSRQQAIAASTHGAFPRWEGLLLGTTNPTYVGLEAERPAGQAVSDAS